MINARDIEKSTKAEIAEWLESIGHKPLSASWPRSRFVEIAVGQREKSILQHKANLIHALRFAGNPPERDLIPTSSGPDIIGWDYNAYTREVWKAWSSLATHGSVVGSGRGMSGSQGGRKLYSTKRMALEALRHEVSMNYASHLLNLDKLVEQEPK